MILLCCTILITLGHHVVFSETNFYWSDIQRQTYQEKNNQNISIGNRNLIDIPTVRPVCPDGQKRDHKSRCRGVVN